MKGTEPGLEVFRTVILHMLGEPILAGHDGGGELRSEFLPAVWLGAERMPQVRTIQS